MATHAPMADSSPILRLHEKNINLETKHLMETNRYQSDLSRLQEAASHQGRVAKTKSCELDIVRKYLAEATNQNFDLQRLVHAKQSECDELQVAFRTAQVRF